MDQENELERAHIVAIGRVQGVGFRWTVKRIADASGVVGTVSNLRDGTVEIWAEAPEEELVVFVGKVFRGSPVGEVPDLRIDWNKGQGSWTSFEIVS